MTQAPAVPIQSVANNIPEIIKAAASSPLGIFALILLIVAALAYVFFKNEGVKVKVPIFAAFFAGAVAFAFAIGHATTTSYLITGHISDSGSSDPVESADVRLEWGSYSQAVETDSDGRYSFEVTQDPKTAPRQLKLFAQKDGYKQYVRTVDNPFYGLPQDLKLHKVPVNPPPETPVEGQLKARDCSEASSMASKTNEPKTRIQFQNSAGYPIQLFWVDYAGKEEFWFEAPNGTVTPTDTYVQHPWVARDVKGKCIGVFVSDTPSATTAEIH